MFQDDTFVEELVVRRKTVWTYLLQVAIVLGAVVLCVAFWLFVPFFNSVLMVITLYAAYILLKFQGVEYEYSFTNGELDIDKIMAKRKRKKLLEINHRKIMVMAPYTAEYECETKSYNVSEVIDASTSKNAANRWFLICEKDEGGYAFVVFQPSKRFRDAMRKYMRLRIKGMDA